jgi:multimeric flavodoxin WrbA
MKILVLQSSGRTSGNTARVAALAEEALRSEAARTGESLELETIHFASSDLHACTGCRSCFDRGEQTCPYADDDLLAIKAKMRQADGLVLAGPVYVNDVNGIMKNWIDRLAHVCHRPEFAGKIALLLATTGSTSAKHTLRSMQVPLWTWGYRIAGSQWFRTGAATSLEETRRRHADRIGRVASQLFQEILLRKYLRPSLISLMVFRIQQAGWSRAAAGSIDYAYWRDHGWLDTSKSTFFFPHRAGPVTTLLARLIGAAVAALFV